MLELVNDPRPAVRAAAVDALGRAISGALGNLGAMRPRSAAAAAGAANSGGGDEEPPTPGGASDSTGGVEHMLLVALEALYNDDKVGQG